MLVIVPLIASTIDEGVWQMQHDKHQTEEDVVEAVKMEIPAIA